MSKYHHARKKNLSYPWNTPPHPFYITLDEYLSRFLVNNENFEFVSLCRNLFKFMNSRIFCNRYKYHVFWFILIL